MSSCGVCTKGISASKLKMTCTDCSRDFHAACLKMSKADIECIKADDLVWRCGDCAQSRRKSMRLESQANEGKLTFEDILAAIDDLKLQQKTYEAGVNKAFEDLNDKLTENHNKFVEESKKTEQYFKVIESLLTENAKLKEKVQKLEIKIEDLEQYSRNNCLEIHGIPQETNENTLNIVKEVGLALDINITEEMIDSCHRLGRKPNGNTPGIIVKFVRRHEKEEFLRKRRVKRNLNLSHVNKQGGTPIYINESLSPERRRLLAMARTVKREKAYAFIWVRNGKIFLRKQENAPVIVVTRQEDLSKL